MAGDGDTVDNNYTGNAVIPPDPNSPEARGEVPMPKDLDGVDEPGFVYYRHKMVARFSIPRQAIKAGQSNSFEFVDSLCKVRAEDEGEFLEAVRGMHRGDSGNIVRVLHVVNERSALEEANRRTRLGAASTDFIPDHVDARSAQIPAAENRDPPGMGSQASQNRPAAGGMKFGVK